MKNVRYFWFAHCLGGKVAESISPGFVGFVGFVDILYSILTQVHAAKLLGSASSEKAEEKTEFPLRRRTL